MAGFTLIELVITIAIVAILSVIAMASYNFAVIKTRRAAAEGCLMQQAQFMERYYTTNFTYVGAAAPACDNDVANFYSPPAPAPTPTAKAFSLQLVPGSNQNDSKCGTLSINETGQKGVTGTGSVDDCW